MKTIERKHHITSASITGYGIEHFRNNYNAHTMNETNERADKHFIPEEFEIAQFDEFVKNATKKATTKKEPAKKDVTKKATTKKTSKKATKKTASKKSK